MKLYRKIQPKTIEKTAGLSIPSNPSQWPTEVMKSLRSQHPYISLSQTETKFDQLEPQEKRASGVIVVQKKVAIPFTIRPSDSFGKPSIDKLDVMFSEGKFAHLNKEAFDRAMRQASHASKINRGDVPPSNRYIGGMTGDVSPLEYSPYTNMTGIASYASFGLFSRVIRHPNELAGIEKFLSSYHGISSIVNSLGFADSLFALRHDTLEPEPESDHSIVQIVKKGSGFKLMFSNGESRLVSPRDLKDMLQEDFTPVMRQIVGRGFCIIRDVPALKSVDVPAMDISPAVVNHGGYYDLMTTSGANMKAIVCTRQISFCGKQKPIQVALGADKTYTEGKAFLGVQVENMSPYCQLFTNNVIEVGATGCFLDESFSSPMVTPKLKINKIISVPGAPNIIIGQTEMGPVGIVLLNGIVKPTKIINPGHNKMIGYEELPENSYYIPTHMSFFTVGGRANLADEAAKHEGIKLDKRKVSTLSKNAMRWTLFGDTEDGYISLKDMDQDEMRISLATLGADDYVLEKAGSLENGRSMKLYGLTQISGFVEERPTKVAHKKKLGLDLFMLKKAAEEYTQGVDQMAQDPTTREEVENPMVLDSILSLQFISDDTLEELVEAEPMLEEVEDKIAKALMASRHGEKAINEKTAAKTLKGIGEVRNSLKVLQFELENR